MPNSKKGFSNVIALRPQTLSNSSHLGKILSRHETGEVLDLILDKAIQDLGTEGGSIYFIQELKQRQPGDKDRFHHVLRFYRSINLVLNTRSLHSEYLEINHKSLAGYVASTGKTVQIKDCYKLPPETPFSFDPSFDQSKNYNTKSVLAVPIKSTEGRVIGVVQLINKRKKRRKPNSEEFFHEVLPFSKHDAQLLEALASQTSVALENAKLSNDIANLFESFVRASVTAIEARDPGTSGHSDRVANMTVSLAEAINKTNSGPLGSTLFSVQQIQEIRYASLLHDFGKIGVNESVLLKPKKLYQHELENILMRIEVLKFKQEAKVWKHTAEDLLNGTAPQCTNPNHHHQNGSSCGHNLILQAAGQIGSYIQSLEELKKSILQANESQILEHDLDIKTLIQFINDLTGKLGTNLLTNDELKKLSIAKGTLTAEERKQIESHVTHTYHFLSQIAWTENLSEIPQIAHAHHEKLDGTGYPLGLKSEQIPLQSKMMTVSDIYDALTALDRPYKHSISAERALAILEREAKQGKVDKNLLDLFIQAQVFKQVA